MKKRYSANPLNTVSFRLVASAFLFLVLALLAAWQMTQPGQDKAQAVMAGAPTEEPSQQAANKASAPNSIIPGDSLVFLKNLPEKTSGIIISAPGSRVTVLDQAGLWSYVSYTDDAGITYEGFVQTGGTYGVGIAHKGMTATINEGWFKLYAAPAYQKEITTLSQGSTVNVLEFGIHWSYITYNGYAGYADSDSLRLINPPVVQSPDIHASDRALTRIAPDYTGMVLMDESAAIQHALKALMSKYGYESGFENAYTISIKYEPLSEGTFNHILRPFFQVALYQGSHMVNSVYINAYTGVIYGITSEDDGANG